MHFIQPDLSPIDDVLSYYMNGRHGWILGLGLIAIGVGSLLLTKGMHTVISPRKARVALFLLALWGVGAVVGGIFPPDPRGHWDEPPSLSGMLHGVAAMVALLAFPPGALLMSRIIGSGRSLMWLAMLSALSLVVFFFCLAPVFSNRPPYFLGLIERLLLGFYAAWLVAACLRVRAAAS